MTVLIPQLLRDAAAALPAERVSLQSLALAHGPAAHGSLLLLLAAPCLLPVPGGGTVPGLGMAALAAAMWRGHCADCLPRRVAEVDLSRHWAQRLLGPLAALCALAGRLARTRLSHLTLVGRRSWPAATVGVMAASVVLPTPFGNLLPALSTMFVGLGQAAWVWGRERPMRWVLP